MTAIDTTNQDLIKVIDKDDTNISPKEHHNKNASVSVSNEKNTMSIIEKLYTQNLNLNKEIKNLSEQLPKLLEKEKTKGKLGNHGSINDLYGQNNANDGTVQKELNNVYNQIQSHQRELKTLQTKYANSATFERYKDLENQATVKDREIERLQTEKKALERSINEKEKAVENLRNQTGADVKVPMLLDELKELKKKLKEAQKNDKELEAISDKDNAEIGKISEELNKVKENYRIMLDRTGYDPRENKFRPKPSATPAYKRESVKQAKVSSSKKDKEEMTFPEFSQENFQNLYNEVYCLRNEGYNKDSKKEIDSLKRRLETLRKEHEETSKRLSDREKESNILTIKLRELHRIARHHSILPDDNIDGVKSLKINIQSKISQILSPVSSTKANTNTFITRPRLARFESYAKNTLLYNGYRKDERGKVPTDVQGEHFSDKELMGNSRPKIIGLKVWHDNRRIVGFQAVYNNNEKTADGAAHVKNPQAYKLESFELTSDDYLKEISGFTSKNDNMIDCLVLMSSKGETKKILEPTKESKFFKFDINELEFPSILYGYIAEELPRHYISKFGVLIASDNIEESFRLETEEGSKKHLAGSASTKSTS